MRNDIDVEPNLPGPDLLLFVLRRATAAVLHDFQDSLDGDDIRPAAYAVLTLLKTRPGLRQSQLSPILGIRRTNLVPLLADLENRGLAERRPVPGDRRAAALHLTANGMTVLVRAEDGCTAHEERLRYRLGPDGRRQLVELLNRLIEPGISPALE